MKSKASALMVIEIGLLCVLVCRTVFVWARPSLFTWPDVVVYPGQVLTLTLCFIIPLYYNSLYNLRVVRSFGEFSTRLPYALGVSFILVFMVFYKCFPTAAFNERPLFSSVLLSLLVVSLLLPLRGIFYSFLKMRRFAERVLILGTSPLAWKIAEEIESASHLGYVVVGFVHDSGTVPVGTMPDPPYPLFGPLTHLEEIVAQQRPDRIIVALTERRGRLPMRDLLNIRMAGVMVEDGIEVHERFTGKLAIESLTPSHLIFSPDLEEPKWQMALRRAASLTMAACGLIVTAPFMLITAVAIKLDSKGPVFFFQDRAGLWGRPFRLVKFRTMRALSLEEEGGSVWSRDDNSRVTRIGKWLRKLHLDEIPQFINILRGDMEFVGPRPEMIGNIKTMTDKIPYYSLRMTVRPGITGWAQIKYGYAVSQDDVTEKMRYDLYYIKHMSFWFDLQILIETVKIVLFSRKSQATEPAGGGAHQVARPATDPLLVNVGGGAPVPLQEGQPQRAASVIPETK